MNDRPEVLLAGPIDPDQPGGDVTAEVLAAALRQRLPEARLTLVCEDEERFRDTLQIATVNSNDLALIAEALHEVDRVVMWGGSGLCDAGELGSTRPLAQKAHPLSQWLTVALMAALYRRPTALAGLSVGPLTEGASCRAVGSAVRLASFASARDAGSAAFLVELGLPHEVIAGTGDLLYLVQRAASGSVDTVLDHLGIGDPIDSVVAVIPPSRPASPEVESALATALGDFSRTWGTTLLVISALQASHGTLAARLQKTTPSGRLIALPPGHSAAELGGILGRCALVLAMSAEGLALSAACGGATASWARTQELTWALAAQGPSPLAFDLGAADDLCRGLETAWARRQAIREETAVAASRQAAAAADMVDRLTAWLVSPATAGFRADELLALAQPAYESVLWQLHAHARECERIRQEGERRRLTERADLASQVECRDRLIVALQKEMFEKIGERDRTIRDLQDEMARKVTERDRIITDLQSRAHEGS